MRVLVLGGSAFLGIHVTRALVDAQAEVTWLNRGRTPASVRQPVRLLHADRDVPDSVRSALRGRSFDAVVDLSGYHPEQVATMLDTDPVRAGARYLFVSSVSVYDGLLPAGSRPIREDDPPGRPRHEYGRRKLACERLLHHAAARIGILATSLRLAPAFGPWDYKCRELFYLRRIRSARPVLLPYGGRYRIHLAAAEHVARVCVALLHRPAGGPTTYNVATGPAVELRQYVELLANSLRCAVDLVDLPPSVGRLAYGDAYPRRWPYAKPFHQEYDTSRLSAHTGDSCDLASALAETVAWYQSVGDQYLIGRACAMLAANDRSIGLYDIEPMERDLATDTQALVAMATGHVE